MGAAATVVQLNAESDLWHGVCPTTGRVAQVLKLPPSTSGSCGMISLDTLRLYASIRQLGVKLVLITGAHSCRVQRGAQSAERGGVLLPESSEALLLYSKEAAGAPSPPTQPTHPPPHTHSRRRAHGDAASAPALAPRRRRLRLRKRRPHLASIPRPPHGGPSP